MEQDTKEDLRKLREELTVAMRQQKPSKQFGATLLIALVGLHLTEHRLTKTQGQEERRQIQHEYTHRKRIIETGIQRLRRRRHQERERGAREIFRSMP